jgi:hypothetical protein
MPLDSFKAAKKDFAGLTNSPGVTLGLLGQR